MEIRLRIESPVSATPELGDKTTIKSKNDSNMAYWTIDYTRYDTFLLLSVTWISGSVYGSRFAPLPFQRMHIVPHFATGDAPGIVTLALSSPVHQNSIIGNIGVKEVLHDGKFCFDIVFSTSNQPLLMINASKQASEAELYSNNTSSGSHDRMLILLKDIYSVDVCFVFNEDKSCSHEGLWAHRSLLSMHPAFISMIENASQHPLSVSDDDFTQLSIANSHDEDEEDNSRQGTNESAMMDKRAYYSAVPIIIPVSKFSMATFCTMLRFIYTGDIYLSVDTNQYAISRTVSPEALQGMAGISKESVLWHSLETDSALTVKDVTWEELLVAADHFGITDLRVRCESEVMGAIDLKNVFSTLFSLGCQYTRIKEAALKFIVKNLTRLIVDDQDPFKPFKDHPECHAMMFEVLRRRSSLSAEGLLSGFMLV
ncbi:hypothetical protein EDD11_001968 [Mortierella claussenii]|nr:hypothetical protein EDD11_001968 [Mortierella claussenii]